VRDNVNVFSNLPVEYTAITFRAEDNISFQNANKHTAEYTVSLSKKTKFLCKYFLLHF